MTVQVEKSCYKLTNFPSAINRNRFQLSPQFNSSRSSYDVILVTFHDVSQSKHSKAMDFALLQVSWESISRIVFRVNAQTETVDAFEYPQRRFLVPMRHDYIKKPVSPVKSHGVAEPIASASVWRRGAGMFSNKVDLMETLISWVVCRTLILLLRYSIVGTTIILWNCAAYHVPEARYVHRL